MPECAPWVAHTKWGGEAQGPVGADSVGARGQEQICKFAGCLRTWEWKATKGRIGWRSRRDKEREAHPNNFPSLPTRLRTEPQWEALGLVEMCLDEEEAQDSGHSREQESMCSESLSSGGGGAQLGVQYGYQ